MIVWEQINTFFERYMIIGNVFMLMKGEDKIMIIIDFMMRIKHVYILLQC